MAKKKPTEKLRSEGRPALMHVSREMGPNVVSPKKMGRPGDTPIAFPPGYANRKTRRSVYHKKKLATRELRERLREKGVSHNTAGIVARVLMNPEPS